MQLSVEQLLTDDKYWQQLCNRLQTVSSLSAIVLKARQMGSCLARAIVEQQQQERAAAFTKWSTCLTRSTRLVSKGLVKRKMLTLVGQVQWRRRVERCPHRCLGSQQAPFDTALDIQAYQQSSTELMRLGCLLAVFLPFDIAAQLLVQLTGVDVSDATIWNWVQDAGQRAMKQLQLQLQHSADGKLAQVESLDSTLAAMPLIIAADGVIVPFRRQPKSSKGKILWQEVKIALLARLGKYQTKIGATATRLHQRRLVAVLGDINALKPRLQLEALRQGITTAVQVVWLSDGARGFWRLYRECFALAGVVGILDFYHAVQHLWQAAIAYHDGNPNRTPQQWFTGLRHRLRHGFGKGIIKELDWLSKSKNTAEATKPILRQVRDYLTDHLEHIQYQIFKKRGLPIGSGMVESACKWLIQQRFKGTGMRWSEDGFNHLVHLRLAWVNGRFDPLFAGDESLELKL